MKKRFFTILSVSILCLMTAVLASAQTDRTLSSAAGDIYVISAKAGGVNYVEGSVSIRRKNGESGYLVKGDNVEAGDIVSTAANARAEIMLNPGSFVRLDRNSEFQFTTTNLNDLTIEVTRGSAIFEVFASNDFRVTVRTPKAKFFLVKTGVYRVDVLNDGIGKVEVYKGKAQVANLSAQEVNKGRMATVNGDQVSVVKYDRKDMDNFEDWSKDRAKMIAKSNKKLSIDKLNNTLLGNNRTYDCFGSYGLWVFNPRYRSYSFLPFGYRWRSPYGYGFNRNTSICNDPFNWYYRPYYNRYPRRTNGNGNGDGTGTGNGNNTVPAANIERRNRNQTPPFRRMENSGNANISRSRRGTFRGFPSTGGSSGRSTRSTRSTRTTRSSTPTRSAPKAPSRPPLSSPKGRGNN